jgi:hypothetical protein
MIVLATEGQDLYDVALQEYGHPGGIVHIAAMNLLSFQGMLQAGQEIEVDVRGIINASATDYYKSRGMRINTFSIQQLPQDQHLEDHDLNHDLNHG